MVNSQFFSNLFNKEQRSLTTVYIVALSSIAIMAFCFQILKFAIHTNQLRFIEAIKLVEQQKNLIEKASSAILDTQFAANKDIDKSIATLNKTFSRLNEKNGQILETLPTDICPKPGCDSTFQMIHFQSSQIKSEDIEEYLSFINHYQSELERITDQLDIRINRTSKKLIYLDILFLFLLVIVLLVQALWGFKPAVNRLNEALSVRSDFISRISHEIRNPMNSIMGMADILKSTNLTIEQNQYVNNLQRSSHALLDMLNNLVDFSGIENKSIQLKESKFNIYRLIDKVTDIISIQAHEKNLELFVNIDPEIPKLLFGDVARIEQVIVNLLTNALKFTNKGYISLKMTCVEKRPTENSLTILIEVEDTGIGIENEKLNSIFKSFVQEDSSIKRRFGGSGLGLAISQEIVNLMDSRIEVQSEKNVGSNFNFSIDLKYEAENSNSRDHFLNENVIFVTGNNHQDQIESYLGKMSVSYSIVRDLKELENRITPLLLQTKIIVDDSLGIVNIINAATILKKNVDGKNVFALMRSNFSKENMELIRKNGYRNFLIKPFRGWHLIESSSPSFYRAEDSSEDVQIESLKGEIKEKKLSILAVDDSNDNLFLLKEILSPITDQIDFANNGLEACEQIEKKIYDLIFMDIQMPVMDGYTAINKIRHDHKEIPIFAITAHAGLVDEKKCKDAGFTGRLTKPINREKIYRTIQNTFGIEIKTSRQAGASPEKKMLIKLMPLYFEARIEDLEALNVALHEKDFATIKKLGHRMKGSAKSYGFDNIGLISHRLEKAADQSNLEVCTVLTHELESKITVAKSQFKQSHPTANS